MGSPAATKVQPHKRVYRTDVSAATNVNDRSDSESGKLFAGTTLEQLRELELQTFGISVATKTSAIDLLSLKRGYPHDKPEGLAVVDGWALAISNGRSRVTTRVAI